MPKENPQPQPHWLNHRDMAAACGVSHQTFDNWGIKPVARIGKQSFYLVADVLRNRIARHVALAKGKPYRLPQKDQAEATSDEPVPFAASGIGLSRPSGMDEPTCP